MKKEKMITENTKRSEEMFFIRSVISVEVKKMVQLPKQKIQEIVTNIGWFSSCLNQKKRLKYLEVLGKRDVDNELKV